MIKNIYQPTTFSDAEVERILTNHLEPTPRNWAMRIQKVFSEFEIDDYTQIIIPEMYDFMIAEPFNRATVWGHIINKIRELWSNHKAWSTEVRLGRAEWEQISQCEVCGTMFAAWRPNVEHNTPWGPKHCCDMCRRTLWTCIECGEAHYGGHDRFMLMNNDVCMNCFHDLRDRGEIVRCSVCGCDAFIDDMSEYNGRNMCQICVDERVLTCCSCGDSLIEGVDRMRWMDDECYCHACYNEVSVVAQYDYYIEKPPMLLASGERLRPDTLLFGLEFEIEDDWNNAEVAEPTLGKRCLECVPEEWGYCKHDGSMYRGVEWVTHPMTPLFYKVNRKAIDDILNKWVKAGFRVDQWDEREERYNCGLHMHLSKDAFTSAHLYKFVRFFYKIHLRKLVQQIAERDANQFAKWRPEDLQHGVHLAKYKKNVSGDRYSVINLIGGHWHEQNEHKPAKTVEFRLFQGTLNPKVFHKNIEFILSVYYFTRDNSLTHITEKNYLRFLGQTKNRWRFLTGFLRKQLGKEI